MTYDQYITLNQNYHFYQVFFFQAEQVHAFTRNRVRRQN